MPHVSPRSLVPEEKSTRSRSEVPSPISVLPHGHPQSLPSLISRNFRESTWITRRLTTIHHDTGKRHHSQLLRHSLRDPSTSSPRPRLPVSGSKGNSHDQTSQLSALVLVEIPPPGMTLSARIPASTSPAKGRAADCNGARYLLGNAGEYSELVWALFVAALAAIAKPERGGCVPTKDCRSCGRFGPARVGRCGVILAGMLWEAPRGDIARACCGARAETNCRPE